MRATTDNPLHGRTLNPWDHDASPGGSSGGGSSAAAAGFGPIHHGNDIGGSLRFPSFACGLASVKPTNSRVPAWNPSQTAERGLLAQLMSVQGAMCREVRDVRLALRSMTQGDPRDPWWVPVPFDGPPLAQPIKVAFTKETYGYPIHPDIAAGLDRAACASGGCRLCGRGGRHALDRGSLRGMVRGRGPRDQRDPAADRPPARQRHDQADLRAHEPARHADRARRLRRADRRAHDAHPRAGTCFWPSTRWC